MATVADSDLKEIKDFLTGIQGQINVLHVSVGKIEATLQTQQTAVQKIPDLAEKVGELKNWKQIALIISGALFGGLITPVIAHNAYTSKSSRIGGFRGL